MKIFMQNHIKIHFFEPYWSWVFSKHFIFKKICLLLLTELIGSLSKSVIFWSFGFWVQTFKISKMKSSSRFSSFSQTLNMSLQILIIDYVNFEMNALQSMLLMHSLIKFHFQLQNKLRHSTRSLVSKAILFVIFEMNLLPKKYFD
jgi:hypothetical protein